jgi:hypothetical protein
MFYMFYLSIMNGASKYIKGFILSIINQLQHRSKGHNKKLTILMVFAKHFSMRLL